MARCAVFATKSCMSLAATLNIYFHVVSRDSSVAGGNVPDSQLADQITVMNEAFSGSGITWRLGASGISWSLMVRY